MHLVKKIHLTATFRRPERTSLKARAVYVTHRPIGGCLSRALTRSVYIVCLVTVSIKTHQRLPNVYKDGSAS